jgi:polyvinyl alcohol dehydrogenase (cytochrome)
LNVERRWNGRRSRALLVSVCAATAAVVASSGVIAGASGASVPSPSRGDLTTYGYGNSRSGHDHADGHIGGLSATPVWDDTLTNPGSRIDGAVYGQPLVYGGVVYVGTDGDTIYAIAARSGVVLWHLHTGNEVRKIVEDTAPTLNINCGDVDPIGILGTPVIDPSKEELFAVEATYAGPADWSKIQHWLVAVSLITHRELWHRSIDPPNANHRSSFFIAAEQQRPALTLLGSRIYVEYGGLYGGCGKYHGFVVSVPDTPSGQLTSYEVPTQREGGIWGTAGAFVAPSGDLYVTTGNGSSHLASDFDEGNSVVELSPSLHRLGFWAPSNWAKLNKDDADLGSASPIGVPDSSLLFAAGKPVGSASYGYLLRRSPLHGIGARAFKGQVCASGGAYGADASDVIGKGASARVYLYVPCSGGTEALLVNVQAMTFARAWSPSSGVPNGPPIVAGGVVWALDWNNALLYGMSPTTGRVLVRRATDNMVHFAAPSVGDGMLFIPTDQGVQAWTTTN